MKNLALFTGFQCDLMKALKWLTLVGQPVYVHGVRNI